MLGTIQRMSYRVRTAYEYSNLIYGGDTIPKYSKHFMMVLFQVNGCVPQIWSIISYIVFSALRIQGFVIHFVNSFMTEISQLVGFSYVEDYKIIQPDDDIEDTHSKMQLAIS